MFSRGGFLGRFALGAHHLQSELHCPLFALSCYASGALATTASSTPGRFVFTLVVGCEGGVGSLNNKLEVLSMGWCRMGVGENGDIRH